ncbi:MAG: hypothetical protein ACXVAE_02935 [Candidatus Limnocylindrales bacterium]
MTGAEPRRATVQYPGGITARYRWAGPGQEATVFASSEAGGRLTDLADLAGAAPDRLCRAELRAEGPLGTWTVRLASSVYDEPQGLLWDTAGLLVLKYGFRCYAFEARGGELRWSHASATPLVAVLGSARLDHVLLQGEIETSALDAQGALVWRAALDDVITGVELIGGRLILTTWSGSTLALDPATGRAQG